MRQKRLGAQIVCLCALLFAGCIPHQRPIQPVQGRISGVPEEFYREAITRGEPVFAIEPSDAAGVHVRVYRDGPLASVGHDHVISSQEVHGYAFVPQDRSGGLTDIYLPLDALLVDDPRSPGEASSTGISQGAREATRRHMLDDVLESAKFPFVIIHGICATDTPSCGVLDARITLHGMTRIIKVPVDLQSKNQGLMVSGHFSFLHSDFEMTPYSVLGGALRVKDKIDVDFTLEAHPAANS